MTDEYKMPGTEAEMSLDEPGRSKQLLSVGEAPDDAQLLRQLSAGVNFITDFWQKHYFEEYIREAARSSL